ncbi:hypothetical protein MRB53_013821 [Persea americana]|uniref:Uncharacterized protein n=1 Tax=Persea americana TaxID=3435 RepID=A0ACC2K917_PERAE|nr:hypothetical protein MRB53_013821 [Persea americana]
MFPGFLALDIVSQQEIVSLYERFCQLDRNAKGFISADEFLSVPEFAVNPHSHLRRIQLGVQNHRVLKTQHGKRQIDDYWIPKSQGKPESAVVMFNGISVPLQRLLGLVDGLNFKDFVAFLSAFSTRANLIQKIELIFRVCDSDCKGKVIFSDILEVLRDVTGSFKSENQKEQVLTHVFEEAGYRGDSSMLLDDFVKILENSHLKMNFEVPAD